MAIILTERLDSCSYADDGIQTKRQEVALFTVDVECRLPPDLSPETESDENGPKTAKRHKHNHLTLNLRSELPIAAPFQARISRSYVFPLSSCFPSFVSLFHIVVAILSHYF